MNLSMLWLFLGSRIVSSNFDWVSDVIRDCFVCALLCYMIGPENLRHSLNQSDAELLPLIAWSSAFSRALGSLVIFIARSHWLFRYFPLFWLAAVITLVLLLCQSIKKHAIQYYPSWGWFCSCYTNGKFENTS